MVTSCFLATFFLHFSHLGDDSLDLIITEEMEHIRCDTPLSFIRLYFLQLERNFMIRIVNVDLVNLAASISGL
jgi:hypothetical protein